jgi:pimeloyl-ACP methyl ester carboxylesterase
MPQPLYDFGGNGALIHLAVANGFPPQTYIPMLRPLLDRYHAVCLPPRALWGDEKAPDKPGSWRSVADDLLAGLREYDLKDLIAIGHSFGGVASLLAIIDEPSRFRALILLDPTIMPPDIMDLLKPGHDDGTGWQGPLVEAARRRRRQFESTDAAYHAFKERRLFSDWPEESLRLYAESMTRPSSSGEGVELTWSADWEAFYYQSFYPYTWDDIPKLRNLLPILAIRGGTSDTFHAPTADLLRDALPNLTYAEIPGHGHLFPQSAPEQTSRVIAGWLERFDNL